MFSFVYRINDFISNWIYPAYNIKNFFFYRYDLVKLHQIKRTQYSDVVSRMLYANMNLINQFIQKEKPQQYVLWYYDEQGRQVGHKYGQNSFIKMYLPQYKDKFIMDIIKQIYNWWNVEYSKKEKQIQYLRQFWSQNINGQFIYHKDEQDDNKLYQMQFDKSKCPKNVDQIKNANWQILNKYFNKEDLLKDDVVFNKIKQLQIEMSEEEQKYLHLAIQVRCYLWT